MSTTSHNGVLVAAILLLVGAAAAGVAWWNTLSQTRLALEYWGPDAAVLVRDAPQVTAMAIDFDEPGDGGSTTPETVLVHPATRAPGRIHEARAISHAKGLVHLRHALLDDRSFDWSAAPRQPGNLGYALTFEREGQRLIVYLSRDFTHLTAAGPFDPNEGKKDAMGNARAAGATAAAPTGRTRHTVSTEPIAEGLQRYFADVLSARATKDER